jgi:hypothetical protein
MPATNRALLLDSKPFVSRFFMAANLTPEMVSFLQTLSAGVLFQKSAGNKIRIASGQSGQEVFLTPYPFTEELLIKAVLALGEEIVREKFLSKAAIVAYFLNRGNTNNYVEFIAGYS